MYQKNICSHRSVSPDVNCVMAEEFEFEQRHFNKYKCQSVPISVDAESALITLFKEFTMESPIQLGLFGKVNSSSTVVKQQLKPMSSRPKRVFFDANKVSCEIIDDNSSAFPRADSVPENNTLPIGTHTHSVALCLMKHFYTNYTE